MKIGTVISTISIAISIAVTVQLTRVALKLGDITVYDIDVVRAEFLQEVQFAFMTGCRKAVNMYAPRHALQTYDANSPMAYCDEQREVSMEYWMEQVGKLGRKESQ